MAIAPQQLTEFVCVSAVGLPVGCALGLNQQNIAALPFTQFVSEPIVEAADLDDSYELGVRLGQLFEKLVNLLRPRTHLPTQRNFAGFVANAHSNLLAVKVNSKVQHSGFSWLKCLASNALRRVLTSRRTSFLDNNKTFIESG